MEGFGHRFSSIGGFESAPMEYGLGASILLAGIVRAFGLPDGLTFEYETLAITAYQAYRMGLWSDHVAEPTRVS